MNRLEKSLRLGRGRRAPWQGALLASAICMLASGPRFMPSAQMRSGASFGTGRAATPSSVAEPQAGQRRPRKHLRAVAPQFLVVSSGTLIDGTGAPPLSDAAVVVRGGRIIEVGRVGDVEVPPSATVIDVRGATILPGVFNAHVHSGYRQSSLEAWAHGGVTTVRDLCGPAQYALVDTLALNPRLARVIAAGPFITVPNGYPIVPWGVTNAVPVTGPEHARAAVNQLVDQGADVIKIALESGGDFGQFIPTLSLQEAAAVVEAAHARGIPVSAHVTTSPDLPRALDAGVDDIAHMVVDYPSSELLARVVRQGVVWVPTLELWRVVGYGHEPRAVANLRRFVEAGGTVSLGTDFDGYDAPFQLGMPVVEMELMLQAGMSPMQVIVSATRNAAHVSNRLADLGTVEVGKIADLIAVRGDPLQDIHAMAEVRLVLHSGVVIRNDGFD
jgi:imidazolonepropionase-like amidohydrolase